MMDGNSRGYIACGLWVAALALMLYGTFGVDLTARLVALAWGVMLAQAAMLFTLLARERLREVSVERIAEVIDAVRAGERDVQHLR